MTLWRTVLKGMSRSRTNNLHVGFNPFEKYDRQIGSFPRYGMNIKIFETTTENNLHVKLYVFQLDDPQASKQYLSYK